MPLGSVRPRRAVRNKVMSVYCRCDDCITLADYILCPYYWALNAVLYVCVPRELSLMERCPYYRCGDCIILGNYIMSI